MGGIQELEAFLKCRAQQGLGVVASRWLGGDKAKAQGRGMGGCPRCPLFLEFTYAFWLSVSIKKIASK